MTVPMTPCPPCLVFRGEQRFGLVGQHGVMAPQVGVEPELAFARTQPADPAHGGRCWQVRCGYGVLLES